MASIIKKSAMCEENAPIVEEHIFKDELYSSDADSPTTILNADSPTIVLHAIEDVEDVVVDDSPGTTVLNFAEVQQSGSTFPSVQFSLRDKKTGDVYSIKSNNATVGKSKHANIQIKNTQTVSRIHASLHIQDEKLFIKDENSLNGTFVNGEKVEQGESREVTNGDVLCLSDVELVVEVKKEGE